MENQFISYFGNFKSLSWIINLRFCYSFFNSLFKFIEWNGHVSFVSHVNSSQSHQLLVLFGLLSTKSFSNIINKLFRIDTSHWEGFSLSGDFCSTELLLILKMLLEKLFLNFDSREMSLIWVCYFGLIWFRHVFCEILIQTIVFFVKIKSCKCTRCNKGFC